MKKKWISLFMTFICILAILTGCAKTETKAELEIAPGQEAEQENSQTAGAEREAEQGK